jgi:hypothetical protein
MSNYKEGQVHQLVNSLEAAGFSADHITKFGQLGEGLQQIIAYLDGKAEIVLKKAEEIIITILTFVKTVSFPAIKGKKTAKCFTGKIFGYRDSDLDAWLPKDQSDQLEGTFSLQKLSQNATFKQAVESFLGITGDIDVLAKTIKERGHITTLPVIESLIEQQEAGEDVGLLTNGWGNFFFVEDKYGSVSVVHAYRSDGQWYLRVRRLVYDFEWYDAYRFFFRN